MAVEAEALVRGADLVVEVRVHQRPPEVLEDGVAQVLDDHALLHADHVHVVAARDPRAQGSEHLQVRLRQVVRDRVDAGLLVHAAQVGHGVPQAALHVQQAFVVLLGAAGDALVPVLAQPDADSAVALEQAAVDDGVQEALQRHEEDVQVVRPEVLSRHLLQDAVEQAERPDEDEAGDEELQLEAELVADVRRGAPLVRVQQVAGAVRHPEEDVAVVPPRDEQDEVEAVEAQLGEVGADPAPQRRVGEAGLGDEHDRNDQAAAEGHEGIPLDHPLEVGLRLLLHDPAEEAVRHARVPDDARERPELDHEALVVAHRFGGRADLAPEQVVRRGKRVDDAEDRHELLRRAVDAPAAPVFQQLHEDGDGADHAHRAARGGLALQDVGLLIRERHGPSRGWFASPSGSPSEQCKVLCSDGGIGHGAHIRVLGSRGGSELPLLPSGGKADSVNPSNPSIPSNLPTHRPLPGRIIRQGPS